MPSYYDTKITIDCSVRRQDLGLLMQALQSTLDTLAPNDGMGHFKARWEVKAQPVVSGFPGEEDDEWEKEDDGLEPERPRADAPEARR